MKFFYVYILRSLKDGKNYAGYTKNLKLRFEQHQNGEVIFIKHRRPLQLIYFEGCLNQQDATKREKYFKTHRDYTWHVFDIPNGTWDIYIEYYKDGDSRNEREEIFIEGDSSGNGWAAICLVDNYDYSVCIGQGKGELNITSSLF